MYVLPRAASWNVMLYDRTNSSSGPRLNAGSTVMLPSLSGPLYATSWPLYSNLISLTVMKGSPVAPFTIVKPEPARYV